MCPPTTHITFSCTTALWEALARDVPKGLTLGRTQKDSVEGTVREQSGPGWKIKHGRQSEEQQGETPLQLITKSRDSSDAQNYFKT